MAEKKYKPTSEVLFTPSRQSVEQPPAVVWVKQDTYNPRIVEVHFVGYCDERQVEAANAWMQRNTPRELPYAPMFLEMIKELERQRDEAIRRYDRTLSVLDKVQAKWERMYSIVRRIMGQDNLTPWLGEDANV